MTGFQVDPDNLSASGAAMQVVAERLSAELSAFQAELAGFGAPWGSDDIGSLIGAAHDEVSAYAFECYQEALDEIASAGVDVAGMGTRYAEIEEKIAGHFTDLHAGLEG